MQLLEVVLHIHSFWSLHYVVDNTDANGTQRTPRASVWRQAIHSFIYIFVLPRILSESSDVISNARALR